MIWPFSFFQSVKPGYSLKHNYIQNDLVLKELKLEIISFMKASQESLIGVKQSVLVVSVQWNHTYTS